MNNSYMIPDFSGDDFVHDKEIQKIRAATRAYQEMVAESIRIVKSKLDLEEYGHRNLKEFSMFRSLEAILLKSYKSRNQNLLLYVSIAEYSTELSTGRISNAGTDEYFFGYFKLDKNYPRTYIHKETLREKIANLLLKTEIDFKHAKKFSRRFFVLSENKDQLINQFQFKDLDRLADFPDMEVELNGNSCLFRNSRRPVSLEEADKFSELAKTIMKVFQ